MFKSLLLSSPSSPFRHCLSPTINPLLSSSIATPFYHVFPRFLRRFHTHRFISMAERPTGSTSLSHNHTNRLASEHSPYLLQHAHNPVSLDSLHVYLALPFRFCFSEKSIAELKVDWYPWGEEAFAEARRRDVPIFLSSISDLSCFYF